MPQASCLPHSRLSLYTKPYGFCRQMNQLQCNSFFYNSFMSLPGFARSKQKHCHFTRSKQKNCHFTRSKQKHCHFTRSKQKHCHFTRSKQKHCRFTRSKQKNCHFTRSKQKHCHFTPNNCHFARSKQKIIISPGQNKKLVMNLHSIQNAEPCGRSLVDYIPFQMFRNSEPSAMPPEMNVFSYFVSHSSPASVTSQG